MTPRRPKIARACSATLLVWLAACGSAEEARSRGIGGLAGHDDFFGVRDSSRIDRAERRLREAPDDPGRLAELATALLGGKPGSGHLEGYVRALDLASRALEIDADRPDAIRARAFALERVFLVDSAVDAWETYLRSDLAEADAAAAGERLAALRQATTREDWATTRDRVVLAVSSGDAAAVARLVTRHADQVRRFATEELFLRWADARQEGATEDERAALRLLDGLGPALEAATGDAMVEKATAALHGDAADSAASGHRAYRDGAAAIRANDVAASRKSFAAATEALGRAASPFRHQASLMLAVCDYMDQDYAAAGPEFERLGAMGEANAYLHLAAHAYRMLGTVETRQSRFSRAFPNLRKAASLFGQIRDETYVADVYSAMEANFRVLGALEEAWAHRYEALSRLDRVGNARRRHSILLNAAMLAYESSYSRAAIEFEQPNVDSARERGSAVELINGLEWMARFHDAIGRRQAALGALRQARAALAELDPSGRAELDAFLSLAEGRVLRQTDPTAAMTSLDRALQLYQGNEIQLAALYPERGRVHVALGRFDLAEADFQNGIELFERNRAAVAEPGFRISYTDLSRRVFDEMIRFQVTSRSRPGTALDYAERARARNLLGDLATRSSRPVPSSPLRTAEIQSLVPERSALVYFAALSDRLLVWAIRPGTADLVEMPVSADELALRVGEMRRLIQFESGSERFRQAAADLYDDLILGVVQYLDGVEFVVVLPDKALHLLPFAALLDRRTGRSLIQDFRLAVAPSATLLLSPTGRSASPPRPPRALVVGNPSFDTGAFSYLGGLPGAEKEARRIAKLYPGSTLLLRDRATKDRFLAELGRHDLVHFAGHAVPSEQPSMSRLLLAPEPATGGTGEVFAAEIGRIDVVDTQLVVLSACGTALGRVSSSEGALSLARPFLAAGVPVVMASLWAVEDDASAVFFETFHRRYREGVDVVSALRDAQLRSIERSGADGRGGSPRTWAAFQAVVGAGLGTKKES